MTAPTRRPARSPLLSPPTPRSREQPEPAPFVDLDRLVLVPFRAVFLASRAFELVLAAFVQRGDGGGAGAYGGGLGGPSPRAFTALCRLCLNLEPTVLDEMTRNVAALAAKVARPVHAPSILISTATLNVQVRSGLPSELPAHPPVLPLQRSAPCSCWR